MHYFYRAHCTPEKALAFAGKYFLGRGFAAGPAAADRATYTDARGAVEIQLETEGGHYTRVTVATRDVGESEIDRVAKRFLAELHAVEEPQHAVRGAY
jgi:hypothetical protein